MVEASIYLTSELKHQHLQYYAHGEYLSLWWVEIKTYFRVGRDQEAWILEEGHFESVLLVQKKSSSKIEDTFSFLFSSLVEPCFSFPLSKSSVIQKKYKMVKMLSYGAWLPWIKMIWIVDTRDDAPWQLI